MKHITKLFMLTLVVAALAMVFAISSSAETDPVIFVSNTGTGDGKSPTAPMGHSEGYVPDDNVSYRNNVMIQAFYKLGATGGTIVIVGPTSLDTCSTNTAVSGKTAAELDCITYENRNTTNYNANPTITITSVYGGVDYRTKGAKLILDHAESCSANLRLKSPTVWKDMIFEYKYDPTWTSYYNNTSKGIVAPFMLEADYCKLVIDTGVECTSVKVETSADGTKTEVPGNIYPAILGGHRQSGRKMNTDVTVKSGTWAFVSAAGYGHSAAYDKSATVDGNCRLVIEGGKIGEVWGSGSVVRAYGTVKGKVYIGILGGEVGEVYLTNGEIYFGPGIKCEVSNLATIKSGIYHSPIIGEILPECTVIYTDQPIIPPPPEEIKPETTTTAPSTTKTPETSKLPVATSTPETKEPATAAPTESNAPETAVPAETGSSGSLIVPDTICGHMPKPQLTTNPPASESADNKEESNNTVLIIIVIISVAITIASLAVTVCLLINQKKAAK